MSRLVALEMHSFVIGPHVLWDRELGGNICSEIGGYPDVYVLSPNEQVALAVPVSISPDSR